LVLCEPIWP